jgi:hypothetical protein
MSGNIFKTMKSLIELEEYFFELLPDKEALAIIKEIEDSQLIILLLNLP